MFATRYQRESKVPLGNARPSQVALAGTSRDTHCQRGFRQPRKIGLAISIVRHRLGRRRMNGGRGPIGPLGKFARTDKRGCRICLVAFTPLVKSRQGCTMTQSFKGRPGTVGGGGVKLCPWNRDGHGKREIRRRYRPRERPAISIRCVDENSLLMLQNYLAQYGYLPPTNPENGAFLSSEKLTAAIEEFQAFAGLNITGMPMLQFVQTSF